MAADAMDMGAAAARAGSRMSHLGPEVHDMDRSRSRSPDSPFQELTPSPEKEQKRRGDRPPRTASKKRPGRADGPARSASMPGPTRGMVMHAVLDQTRELLPSHEQFTPFDGSPEARLLNLERQANYDHQYFLMVHAAVTKTHGALKSHDDQHKQHIKANLDFRKEFYVLRDKVPEVKTMVEGIPAQIEFLIAPLIDAKIDRISNAIIELQTTAAQMSDKHAAMERYLEALHGERPREGQQVLHTFLQMDSELTNVKEMVRKIEAKGIPNISQAPNISLDSANSLGKDVVERLNIMHQKMGSLDVL